MITCWIVVNGALFSSKFAAQYAFIQSAAEQKGVHTQMVKNNEPLPLALPHFVLFMDKDIHLAKQLEIIGIPVYNSADAIQVCDNKIMTHLALTVHKIRAPKTIFAPFVYSGMSRKCDRFFDEAASRLGYPLVIKEAYGSFGEQVYLVQNRQKLMDKIFALGDKSFLLQEFISTSYGRDLRLNIVGDQCVAAMHRQSDTDFRANASQGGKLSAYQPTTAEIDLAVKATKATGADFAGVDLLFGENEPLVCEVNTNAHLLNIYYTTGVDVAAYMIEYCLNKLGTETGV